jgi:NDP-sugar pyrophosphorylase family protein
MVLGAGRGTRLGELGRRVPKVLVEVSGVPLLERQVAYLASHGVRRVVVNAHHLGEAVAAWARGYRGPAAPAEVVVVQEPELLGTAGGVRNALGELGEDPFYVLYGDVVVDHPLAELAATHGTAPAAATVAVYETDDVEGKGTVETDADGWVLAFREKQPGIPIPALVNAGLYLVEPELIASLEPGAELDFGHDVFPAALRRGERIRAHRLPVPVIDVGTPEGLARARDLTAPLEVR